eukprot:Nk52_evm1s2152 gene=Nk52_evmTU1s2152
MGAEEEVIIFGSLSEAEAIQLAAKSNQPELSCLPFRFPSTSSIDQAVSNAEREREGDPSLVKKIPPSSWANLFKGNGVDTAEELDKVERGPVQGGDEEEVKERREGQHGFGDQAVFTKIGTGEVEHGDGEEGGIESDEEEMSAFENSFCRLSIDDPRMFSQDYLRGGRKPVGLINQGNMCFMNSILQGLFACPIFYHVFSKLQPNISLKEFPTLMSTAPGNSNNNDNSNLHSSTLHTPMINCLIRFVSDYSATQKGILKSKKMRNMNSGASTSGSGAGTNASGISSTTSGYATNRVQGNSNANAKSSAGFAVGATGKNSGGSLSPSVSFSSGFSGRDVSVSHAFSCEYIYDSLREQVLENAQVGAVMNAGGFHLGSSQQYMHVKGAQEDAEEFLGCILDSVHEEFLKCMRKLKIAHFRTYAQTGSNGEAMGSCGTEVVNGGSHRSLNSSVEELIGSDNAGDEGGWHEVGKKNQGVSITKETILDRSPISDIFGGKLRSVVKVKKAKSPSSITLQPFNSLQLEIQSSEVSTISDAIHYLMKKEVVEDYFCSTSQVRGSALKHLVLDELPLVFVLHLKRFVYDFHADKVRKVTKDIIFPHSLRFYESSGGDAMQNREEYKQKHAAHSDRLLQSIGIPCGPGTGGPSVGSFGDNEYELFSVVYHHGQEAHGGHYTTCLKYPSDEKTVPTEAEGRRNFSPLKTSNGSLQSWKQLAFQQDENPFWYEIDDSQVFQINPELVTENVCGKDPYVLFYRRVR